MQRGHVVVLHEGFCRRARRLRRLARRAAQQAVVLRDVGESWQEQRIRQVVGRGEDQRLQVHGAGHQDQAAERRADALQLVGQRRTARRAVAFAGQVQRRAPALVARQPEPHDLGQRLDIAIHRQHLLARGLAGGDGPAGVRRVDEDEVEVFEPAVRVVGHGIGRGGHAAVVRHHHALRAEGAQVQPDRRRARPAVEGKAHRPAGGVRAIQ